MFKKGDNVRCSMDGETWFNGTYQESSDIFVEHGVFVFELGEIRFFVKCEEAPAEKKERQAS